MQRVFVGDVQGCAEELEALLARVERRVGEHELWLVGDVVNRGPASLRALTLVRERVERGRARLVLGNHELALLRTALGLRPLAAGDTFGDVLASRDLEAWVEWLRRQPLVETGTLAGTPFAMVHAAVHPDWDLAALGAAAREAERRLAHPDRDVARALLAADPAADADLDVLERLLSCRSVRDDGAWSAEEPDPGARAWHAAWRARRHGYGVVYGHWSVQGLVVEEGLRGIDTGCVHHGRGRDGWLTAWVPDARPDPFGLPDTRFLQERAHVRYVLEPEDAAEAARQRTRRNGD